MGWVRSLRWFFARPLVAAVAGVWVCLLFAVVPSCLVWASSASVLVWFVWLVFGRSALRLAWAVRLRARLGAAGSLVSVWFLLAGPLRAWRGPCACGVRLGWRRAGSGLVVFSSSLGCRLVLFCRPLRGCRRCCCALLPFLPRFFRSCLPAAAALARLPCCSPPPRPRLPPFLFALPRLIICKYTDLAFARSLYGDSGMRVVSLFL